MKNSSVQFSPGEIIFGFEVKKVNVLPKLSNVMYQLEHRKTGALLIHLKNSDDNNCFGVAFRTTPKDSTGVAHILEHTALCGSKRFPVRDPFFSMINRSMNSFMNAFTASDWTMYPFSTQNEKDFYNLMEVYLDAAFYPKLLELNFRQEGHRLEFEEPANDKSPLAIKGVVYNEMKGAMSSQNQIMHQKVNQALFPTITYGHNSGGDPEEIITLTHQELIDFHQYHYHPSNSYFYTYGNLPLEKHLHYIDKRVLSHFEAIEIDTTVATEKRYKEPQSFNFSYPLNAIEDDGKKVQVALNWLTCRVTEPLDVLSLQLINLILLGHAGAPLKKVLMESQLGKSLADTTGYEDNISETFFSVGLQAVAKEDVGKVEQLILKTIKSIVEKGLSKEQVELAIHQMELDTREISGSHYPYGLNLLFRFFGTWMHGGDPVKAIDFDKTIDQLRIKLNNSNYLESQINKFILDNPHRVKVVLQPDHSLEKKRADKLKQKLKELKARLGSEEINDFIRKADELKIYQEQDEDISVLPGLSISDIPPEIKHIPPYQSGLDELDITYFDRPTNGIFYAFWYFKLSGLSEWERSWLPTLSTLLPNLGAAGLSYNEFAKQVNRYTGGFQASPGYEKALSPSSYDLDYFTLSGRVLSRNLNKLFTLAGDILNSWDFSDLDRVRSLISQRANALINSVSQSGHSYAASLAKRKFSHSAMVHEIYGGIHQVQTLRELAKLDSNELKTAINPLEQLLKKIFTQNNLSMMMVGEKEDIKSSQPLVRQHIATLKTLKLAQSQTTIKESEPEYQNEAWLTTTPVSYVAQCYKTFRYLEGESSKLLVFSNLLKSHYLHGEIREKGGAYGAMSSYDPDEGVFTLLSYRDPHFTRTLDVFAGVLDWLKKTHFSEQQVEEAILRTCAKMDTPTSPVGKATVEYSHIRKGRTKKMRRSFREGVISSTKEELIEVGTRCLEGLASMSAISSEEIVKREKKQLEEKMLKTFPV